MIRALLVAAAITAPCQRPSHRLASVRQHPQLSPPMINVEMAMSGVRLLAAASRSRQTHRRHQRGPPTNVSTAPIPTAKPPKVRAPGMAALIIRCNEAPTARAPGVR